MSSSSAHQLSLRPTAPVASLEETKSDASLSTNPLADVRLVSSDKVGFPTQKVFLVAASVVFADMVATTGSSVDGDGSDMPDIALVEPAKVLELFLRFIDRTAKRPQLLSLEQAERLVGSSFSPPLLSVHQARMSQSLISASVVLSSLLQIADKYDSPVVMDMARIHARRFINSSPAVVFGLAVAFGTLELAQEALAQFDAVVKQDAPAISRVREQRLREQSFDGYSVAGPL